MHLTHVGEALLESTRTHKVAEWILGIEFRRWPVRVTTYAADHRFLTALNIAPECSGDGIAIPLLEGGDGIDSRSQVVGIAHKRLLKEKQLAGSEVGLIFDLLVTSRSQSSLVITEHCI